jgi:tetratricopeptide (TPR) repeat protein
MARSPGSSPSPEALFAETRSRANAGDVAGAEALLKVIPKASEVALDAARLAGVLRFSRRDVAGAERCFAQVARHQAARPMDHVNHGLALAGLARWHKAETCYRKAIAQAPELVEAWFNLGNLRRDPAGLCGNLDINERPAGTTDD